MSLTQTPRRHGVAVAAAAAPYRMWLTAAPPLRADSLNWITRTGRAGGGSAPKHQQKVTDDSTPVSRPDHADDSTRGSRPDHAAASAPSGSLAWATVGLWPELVLPHAAGISTALRYAGINTAVCGNTLIIPVIILIEGLSLLQSLPPTDKCYLSTNLSPPSGACPHEPVMASWAQASGLAVCAV